MLKYIVTCDSMLDPYIDKHPTCSGGLKKGPVASDYPARVTGGWVYILSRGIHRAALVSKQGFLPILPSTVSEQV